MVTMKFLMLYMVFVLSFAHAEQPFFRLHDNTSLEEYYEYILKYLKYTESYVLQTNNSESLTTEDSSVYDFGTFDFIIVGGGTAGSALANRLSEESSWKVLLLEAGNETENPFTDIPAMCYYLPNSSMNWGYFTKSQSKSCLGMIDQKCAYPTGKVLGGSGVLGHMVYTKGNRQDFDNWADMGNPGWSFKDMLPYFKKSEQIQIEDYDFGFHGHSGPVKVNHTSPKAMNSEEFLAANRIRGLRELDINGREQVGISRFQGTFDFNKRLTGGSAYILPIIESRNNLNVILGAFVTKVLINDNNVATGVQFVVKSTTYTATANKEVILSAGAINSPQILMLSGVGPKEDLENLNITVKNDLPVGKYLSDHCGFLALYIRTNQTAPNRTLKENLERYIDGLSPLTTVFHGEHIAFLNTKNPLSPVPNIEILTINPPLSVPADPKMYFNMNSTYVNLYADFNSSTDFLVYVINLKPKSKGSVTLSSNDPIDFPIIDTNYYSDPDDEDIENVYEGIQYVLSLLETEPLKSINASLVFYDSQCEPSKSIYSTDYWYCAIRHFTSTLYHPSGTTRMGLSRKNSVVDANLKVHNMTSLRVVDAGVMPEIVSGHLLAAIWAIAEKISDEIKIEYNCL